MFPDPNHGLPSGNQSPRQMLDYSHSGEKPDRVFRISDIIQIVAAYLLGIFLFAIGVTQIYQRSAGQRDSSPLSIAGVFVMSLFFLGFGQFFVRWKRNDHSRN